MSKMGYREGSGLGAKEQGISRALQVQRTGRNVGLIVGEEKAAVITSLSEEENEEEERRGGSISYILDNNAIPDNTNSDNSKMDTCWILKCPWIFDDLLM
ncbi:unnamed protein product [Meloidogyne enterolobii]|uniref:Uncharacterized protein n=1 Tax=Meloidogyne enterolobii TaxID=390850 RepID=A0ACB1AKY2_MELEN